MTDDHGDQPIGPPGGADGAPPADVQGEAPRTPSRKAAWLGMGAVAVTIGLLWMVPALDDPHTDEQPAVAGPSDDEDARAIGKPARLDLKMKDVNGVDVTLASFKGKVILLNFWATWCGPCKVEIPDLVALQDQYRDDLVVLGVLVLDEIDKVPPYAAEYKINYPLLDGNNREDVEVAYGPFYGIPSTIIIGSDGLISQKHSGIRSRAQLEREIKALLPSETEES